MALQSIVLYVHMLVAVLIVVLVLLQRGKGAEAGTGFGTGASGTVFGARGSASFFSRTTAVLATLFFATSMTLAYLARQTTAPTSILDEAAPTGPAAPPQVLEPSELPELPSPPAENEQQTETGSGAP